MNRERTTRGLRIAASAVCLLLCVVLCVLWVRSYWRYDYPEGHVGEMRFRLRAASGNMRLDLGWWGTSPKWEWRSRIIEEGHSIGLNPGNSDRGINFETSFFNVSFSKLTDRFFVWTPLWLPTSLAALLAAAPWIITSIQFSMRTLLIVTTLIAVLLGAVVIAAR